MTAARLACLLLIAALLSTATGCGDDDATSSSEGTVMVFAAASLTDAFRAIGDAFEDSDAGLAVEFNFAGSSALATQIQEGAPADVFASADESNMQKTIDSGDVSATPAVFARNLLEIAVPEGNPGGVEGLSDFADSGLLIGLCAEEVPCGRFGRQVLDRAGVTPSIDTNEPDVRSLLTKIESGDLDAGIVYRTDVLAAGDAVDGVEIPENANVAATYPIAPAGNSVAADAFVAFVMSDAGQAILADHGFLAP